jgi:hypothetical protein
VAVRFDFSEPTVDGPLETHWDALLRVVGLLTIVIEGKRWYSEPSFCLVEFAKALIDWLDQLAGLPADLVYSSLESAERELIRFTHLGDGRWQVRSPHEAYREERTFSTDDLRLAAERYLDDLGSHLPERRRVMALLAPKKEHGRLIDRLRRGDA